MKVPFDDLYMMRQLLHASRRLSAAFPDVKVGVISGNWFYNLIFSLAVDNTDKGTFSFGAVMDSILGGRKAVWMLSDSVEIQLPIETLYQMVPDPKVREWLMNMESRAALEEI